MTPHVYPHQIAFNLLPEIDVFHDNGYTKEEMKMVNETRKIMHAPEIAGLGHLRARAGLRRPLRGRQRRVRPADDAPTRPAEILAGAPGVKVLDDPTVSLYPQPWMAAGQDDVYVGRIREDISLPNGLAMWIVSDNIRKGAALNAVQIAEILAERGLLGPGRNNCHSVAAAS